MKILNFLLIVLFLVKRINGCFKSGSETLYSQSCRLSPVVYNFKVF